MVTFAVIIIVENRWSHFLKTVFIFHKVGPAFPHGFCQSYKLLLYLERETEGGGGNEKKRSILVWLTRFLHFRLLPLRSDPRVLQTRSREIEGWRIRWRVWSFRSRILRGLATRASSRALPWPREALMPPSSTWSVQVIFLALSLSWFGFFGFYFGSFDLWTDN